MKLPESHDDCVLLHNPRCSKSRAAKALLEERGIAFSERAYMEDPLSREELEELARRLGRPPSEWVRSKETAFAEAGLSADSTDDELFDAMTTNAILIERPILVRGDHAILGRPPEVVLDLVQA